MRSPEIKTVGLIGFGAFGRLTARHIAPHFDLCIHDPRLNGVPGIDGARSGPLTEAAGCDLVILAVPVASLREVCRAIAPDLHPGAIVVDVGSVKVEPVRMLRDHLPPHVDLVGTHPLFGPQSAASGVAGHKIAVCPVRGSAHLRLSAFLRKVLGLHVMITTPEEHDREAALSQGLTHLIAKVLTEMGPLPERMTTASYDLLVNAIAMVKDDPPTVLDAIERANPYARGIREQFFDTAAAVRQRFEI